MLQLLKPVKPLTLAVLFCLLAGLFPGVAPAGTEGIPIFVNGQELNLDEPAIIQDGHVLAPVRALAEALQATVTWNEGTREVIITGPQMTLKMVAGSRDVYRNKERLSLAVPVQIRNGRVLAPVRFLAESLGAEVSWNAITLTIAITIPSPPVAERVYAAPIPARLAFTSGGILYLLEGSQDGAAPVQVTKEDTVATILGWSHDGRWLAYLLREKQEDEAARPYLWVVRADGSDALQVDPRPVLVDAAWSPVANILAYSTQGPGGGYAPDMNLKLAAIKDDGVQITALLPDGSEVVEDFAWTPDGQALAVSLPRTEDQPLRIDRLTLAGGRHNLLTLGEAGTAVDEIYFSYATGLTWSPNGRYLAYYLHFNAASLSADGVPFEVLDLDNPGRSLNLGTCLPNRRWLAWSPDGNKLAFIHGSGREATTNKHLGIVTLPEGQIDYYDQPGLVDSQPLWLPAPDDGVLICRGLETTSRENQQPGVLVRHQRIWLAENGGQARPLTTGDPGTADYYPSVSPDGRDLYFLRLESTNSCSLYRQPLDGGPAVELVRNLGGTAGYYGNYYPAWISIYYPAKKIKATGKLVVGNVEGCHFELETGEGRLVLLPEEGSTGVAKDLEKYAGQVVMVIGTLTNEPNIYMRGAIMRVNSVMPVQSPTPANNNEENLVAGIDSFTIAPPDLVIKGKKLARVEIWAVPTGTGVTEKDYTLLGQATKQVETGGQQVWTFTIPRTTIMATEIFARGYNEQGREAGRISLPVTGVTALNEALGTMDN
ncbi:stalk domain-containing protein [Moorella sulfitireducens]|uniref:stalk domain-containing protein n=1 Tax=Neomoorella sulfitireducens TaxID=2972948 RepID=UPI0021ACAD5C|nr:stalk domain-containing protein [Moorella sulfitireducens]